jgi:hypothetical protein
MMSLQVMNGSGRIIYLILFRLLLDARSVASRSHQSGESTGILMSGHKCVFASLLFIGLAWSLACEAQAPKKSHWIGTWATAPMLAEDGFRVHPFSGVTLREIAHISVGGDRVRIRFTNEFGSEPLTISDAHVAMSGGGSGIQAGTDHALTFGGSSSVKVPPGAVLLSDPVQMAVPPLADVAVSFYLPAQVMRAETFHDFADQDNYVVNGDVAATPTLTEATTLASMVLKCPPTRIPGPL